MKRFSRALLLLLLLVNVPVAKAEFIPLHWKCRDGSQVSIRKTDGLMTVLLSNKRKIDIPYAAAFSRHQAWNAGSKDLCGTIWPCAFGGSHSNGVWYLSLFLDEGQPEAKCKATSKPWK